MLDMTTVGSAAWAIAPWAVTRVAARASIEASVFTGAVLHRVADECRRGRGRFKDAARNPSPEPPRAGPALMLAGPRRRRPQAWTLDETAAWPVAWDREKGDGAQDAGPRSRRPGALRHRRRPWPRRPSGPAAGRPAGRRRR